MQKLTDKKVERKFNTGCYEKRTLNSIILHSSFLFYLLFSVFCSNDFFTVFSPFYWIDQASGSVPVRAINNYKMGFSKAENLDFINVKVEYQFLAN